MLKRAIRKHIVLYDLFTITRFTLYFSCPVPHCLSLYMFLLACSLFACLLTNGLPLKTPPSKVTVRSCTKVVFRGPAPVRSSRTGRWPMKSVWTPWRTSSRKPGSSPRKPTRNTMRSLYGSLDVVWFCLSCLQYACHEYFITMPSVASSCIIKSRFSTLDKCFSVLTKRPIYFYQNELLCSLLWVVIPYWQLNVFKHQWFLIKFLSIKSIPLLNKRFFFKDILTKPRKLTCVSLICTFLTSLNKLSPNTGW